jgi:hypothetical protein
MNCPNCKTPLKLVGYEGIGVETCEACGGEWLDAPELAKILALRKVKFTEKERQEVAEATTIMGVRLASVDRNLVCPKCGATTDPVNYGGDTGIIIDRCTSCGGIWLDKDELEKVQQVIEGWEDMLPEDSLNYTAKMRAIAADVDQKLSTQVNNRTYLGAMINAIVNRILDLT